MLDEKKLKTIATQYEKKPYRRRWTTQEKKLLKKYYRKVPAEVLAKEFNRSVDAIYHMAKKLGLCEVD